LPEGDFGSAEKCFFLRHSGESKPDGQPDLPSNGQRLMSFPRLIVGQASIFLPMIGDQSNLNFLFGINGFGELEAIRH